MNSVTATTGSSNIYAVDGLTGATGLSPEALLAYCQQQLGGLDTEMKNSINQQNLELQEREAAESAQGVLESFGDNGPTGPGDMQKCVDAINQAISSLPAGDPVAAQLMKFETDMTSKYGFDAGQPGRPLTPAEQNELTTDQAIVNLGNFGAGYEQALGRVRDLNKIQSGTSPSLAAPPQNNDWKGTCTTLDNLVGDIKSGAEIQMLSLQDLVSQRQQAVSLACSMMSKEDSSLEQLSHLGQQ